MLILCKLFLIFILFSFLGWLMEVLFVFATTKKIINRGFLIGPLCPIYGVGCLFIVLTLSDYKSSPIIVFVMSLAICSIVEYTASYLMEKIFKTRWWDYKQMKFNINGRICLEMLVPFGLLGLLTTLLLYPIANNLISLIPASVIYILSAIILIVFITDLIISYNVILSFKNTVQTALKSYKDSTEEVTKFVKKKLLNQSALLTRLIKSFPNFKLNISNIKEHIRKKYTDKK